MTTHWLVLGCDLTLGGQELGPRSISRLEGAVVEAEGHRNRVNFCTAATFSPAHEEQQNLPMSTLAANYLHDQLEIDAEQVVDITGEGSFNTRGELAKFVGYALQHSILLDQLVISSAWWHIPRAKAIFRQMFGKEAAKQVTFVGTAESLTVKLAAYELIKWVHMFLPEQMRHLVEHVVRNVLHLNPSF